MESQTLEKRECRDFEKNGRSKGREGATKEEKVDDENVKEKEEKRQNTCT